MKAGDPRLDSMKKHMEKYRELAGQGKMAEAGRELDAIQSEGFRSNAESCATGATTCRTFSDVLGF